MPSVFFYLPEKNISMGEMYGYITACKYQSRLSDAILELSTAMTRESLSSIW